MVELSGELVAYPLPNQQGLWAYRQFTDGTMLEVELTKEEWFALHERHRTKELDKIRKLNQHPLNQASNKLLERAKESSLPDEIYLISLARFAFAEDVPDWNERFMALNDWTISLGTMYKAILVLEEKEVTPEDLLSCTLKDAARLVLNHLLD
jgi:hypothetical protein